MYIENYEIVQHLGSGAYGQVYLGKQQSQDNNINNYYAIKTLQQAKHDRQRGFQRMEIGLHARLSGHPHIIQLEKVIREKNNNLTHLVLEYAPEGDLFTAITERDIYAGNHPLIKRVFLQLLDAVQYCHDNGVYHRDLKSENVLVFDGGRNIKLADFGLATMDVISTEYGCGSTFYFSPECQGDLAKQRQQRVGYATAPNDIWALGVILINLAAGRNPWKQASLQDETFRAYLADPDFLLKILPISRDLNRILKRIFCVDPLRRIGLKELKQRIQQCKYFTRTAEVDRWERLQDLSPTCSLSSLDSIAYKTSSSINNNNINVTSRPPSPPLNHHHHHHHQQQQQSIIKLPPIQQYAYHHQSKPSVNINTKTTPIHTDLPPSPPSTPRDQSLTGDVCFNDSLLSPLNPNVDGHLISLMF
ncbi:kinase-like domain-containing protein [Cunninghamella echinulata]|nr:kinase-like domain-containing protein [Cunninghamella echinulata]